MAFRGLSIWIVVLLAVSASACTSHGVHPGLVSTPSTQQGPRSESASTTSPDNRFLEPVQLGKFLTTNCTGWRTGQYWPGEAPAGGPPSWNPAVAPPADVIMEWFDCKRISFAGLERGPVQMVLDFTNSLDVPEGCAKRNHTTGFYGTYAWGLSDQKLVDALVQRLGAPAYLIQSNSTNMVLPEGNLSTVTWGPPGMSASSLQIFHGIGTAPETLDPERLFWQNRTGVAAIELEMAALKNLPPERAGYGTLNPPMRFAEAYPTFVWPTDWYSTATLTGTIYSWSDLKCEHPSGSQPP